MEGKMPLTQVLTISSSRAEKEPQDATRTDRTYLVGLCTGLFAAAAVASTPTVSTLIPLAIQAVLMAFRLGSHVGSLAAELSPASEKSESWTSIVPGVTPQKAESLLDEFHSANVSLLLPPPPQLSGYLAS